MIITKHAENLAKAASHTVDLAEQMGKEGWPEQRIKLLSAAQLVVEVAQDIITAHENYFKAVLADETGPEREFS